MGKTREKFLGMERDLAKELLRLWRETCAKALKEIFRDLPAFTSKEAMELLHQSLADLLGPAFGNSPEAQSLMKWGVKRAYRAAKSEFIMPVPEKGKASPTLSLPDHRAINVLTRHNCFWLGQRYGNAIGPKISELTQKALDDGLGRDELAESLRYTLGEAAPGGYTYWDVVASAAIVRARSFGALSGMEEAGITEYEILAMGDERMCPICGAMNGRTFSVAKTREVVNRVLDISDPEKFKAAMPWQTKTPKGKSNADLLASGQSLPPFHGRCRCTLVVVAETEATVEPPKSKDEIAEITARLKELRTEAERLKREYEYVKGQADVAANEPDATIRDVYAKKRDKAQQKWQDAQQALDDAISDAAKKGYFASGLKRIEGEHTPDQDLAAVNPNYSTGKKEWRQNCQRCVITYEARRRGYDVEALPCMDLSLDDLAYMDDKTNGWTSVFDKPQLLSCASSTGEGTGEKVREQMKAFGDGARAIVRVGWKTEGAHVFIAEQRGEETVFIDPQSNKKDVSLYFSECKEGETYLMRVDDRGFMENIKKCCKDRK